MRASCHAKYCQYKSVGVPCGKYRLNAFTFPPQFWMTNSTGDDGWHQSMSFWVASASSSKLPPSSGTTCSSLPLMAMKAKIKGRKLPLQN